MFGTISQSRMHETSFSRAVESQRLWQGAICHVWTSQFDKHWRQSQKQLQKYNIRDVLKRSSVKILRLHIERMNSKILPPHFITCQVFYLAFHPARSLPLERPLLVKSVT